MKYRVFILINEVEASVMYKNEVKTSKGGSVK